MSPRLQFAALSDIGQVRGENQDRWLIRAELQLAAVADGMGGMPCGDEAAQLAIDRLAALPADGVPADLSGWGTLLDELNRAVFLLGLDRSPQLGTGTTLTVVQLQGRHLHIAHVGDSAVFRLRDAGLVQLSREHTVAAEMRERRAAGLVQRIPPGAEHILSSCLGLPYLPQKDVQTTDLLPGDRLLLCSDGLTKPVPAETIRRWLADADSPAAAAERLVAAANAAAGPDNITAVVGFFGP